MQQGWIICINSVLMHIIKRPKPKAINIVRSVTNCKLVLFIRGIVLY